jgi:protein disulfide-isomerase A6
MCCRRAGGGGSDASPPPIVSIDSLDALRRGSGGKSLWLVVLVDGGEASKRLSQDVLHLSVLVEGLYKVGVVDTKTPGGKKVAEKLLPAYKNSKGEKFSPIHVIYSGDGLVSSKVIKDSTLQGMANALIEASTELLQGRANRMQQGAGGGGGGGGGEGRGKSNEDSHVVVLTGQNFDELVYQSLAASLVAFTAPWCGHCQRLRPEWDQASALLARQVGTDVVFLGWVDATVETSLAQQYQVQGYPTIYFVPPPGSSHARSRRDAVPYQGERTAAALAQYALRQLEKFGALTIPQLLSSEDLEDKCGGANHLCILAILPHLADASVEARKRHLGLVQSVANRFPSVSFLWSEGTAQPALEESFGLTFGFPAVVAYTVDRQAYAVMRGSFSEKSLTSFLHSITAGRIATQPLPSTPRVESVRKWDGKAWEGIAEDEFSLEDIMGDEL